MNSTDTISTLNDLIQTLKDGQEGFLSASENASRGDLKTLFHELSQQRSRFAGELQQEVTRLGDPDPAEHGSVAATLHRGWIGLKGAITNRDDHAILAECERGEDSAVAGYRDALESELPGNVREIVQRQSIEVKAAHDRVKALRDSAKK